MNSDLNKNNTFNSEIAVIIPAYKPDYLNLTLISLANQTDTDFSLYIGDDNSPSDLLSIIKPFEESLKITYVRFEENLGRRDLVAHWNRCIEMMNGENFFFLFSDDDMLERECISKLKEALNIFDENVFHFDLKIIDDGGTLVRVPPKYPVKLSALQFFDRLYSGKIDARMPEFVFRTSYFKQQGGFVNFKDAIRSDNATVIKCSLDNGIRTVKGPCVLWRDSGQNISTSLGIISKQKYYVFLHTTVAFFNWLEELCEEKRVTLIWSITKRFDFLYSYGYNLSPVVGHEVVKDVLKTYRNYPTGLVGLILWVKLAFLKFRRKFGLLKHENN